MNSFQTEASEAAKRRVKEAAEKAAREKEARARLDEELQREKEQKRIEDTERRVAARSGMINVALAEIHDVI